jgi:ADP-ribosylglycohydrolase
MRDRTVGGVLGLVIGDALGVPVEFRSRQELQSDPVTGMRGFGTHNQPPGTWSDDSSMALATLESLLGSYSPADMMAGFRKWFYEAGLSQVFRPPR